MSSEFAKPPVAQVSRPQGGMTIRTKLLIIPVLSLGAILGLQALNLYFQQQTYQEVSRNIGEQMMTGHRNALKAAVQIEAASLGARLAKIEGRDAKIAAIIADTDPIRFFADSSGYFFTYDLTGIRVNVPINKAANGQNLIGLTDKTGIRFVEQMTVMAKAGGGFVDYFFEKEGSGLQPKSSYVMLIPGTDILIGTGIYTDNVAAEKARVADAVATRNWQLMKYLLGAFVLITALVLFASLGIARAINDSIRKVIRELQASSNELASASEHVASSSQSLADGSSQQAASLEETSATLEEISGMTKRNAQSATHAKELANQTRQAAELGAGSIGEMRQAMDAIKESSGNIAKIVHTIDEIAFQTNILALNAAVEAARAGEAGAGFAVVADEVRSLAQRSAQSAKETASQIEDSVSRSEHGVQISVKVAEGFEAIVAKARQVDTLVAEIATGSNEQQQGVGQVTTAVSHMDQVTQTNAATAEESAAAAEELSAQADVMRASVRSLQALVGGTATDESAGSDAPPANAGEMRTTQTSGTGANRMAKPSTSRRTGVFLQATSGGRGNGDGRHNGVSH